MNMEAIGTYDVTIPIGPSSEEWMCKQHITIGLPEDFTLGEDQYCYLNLCINGGEPQRFWFKHYDYGTIGYARMQGSYAMGGQLSNVSIDWGTGVKREQFPIIHAIGTWDRNKPKDRNTTLTLWTCPTKK